MDLNIKDVRAEMPNYENYKDSQRKGAIEGIAIHHSATADRATGAPIGNALIFFRYHVHTRGWNHGGYNYVITADGTIEYALDEKIAAYHAGFRDPDDSEGLEYGQYWNNHYLAICVAGLFAENRTYRDSEGHTHKIPNNYTSPTDAQMESLLKLLQHLRQKYEIPLENIRGHRELAGNRTSCPGYNFGPAEIRTQLKALEDEPDKPDDPFPQPKVGLGEHVLLLPDTDKYLKAAMAYIWKFRPDVSFAIDEARGRWKYISVVGDKEDISDSQLVHLRSGGAELVQRIPGNPQQAQEILDDLVEKNLRFLYTDPNGSNGSGPQEQTYTVQPGDTLSRIALQIYGQSSLWRLIFEANRSLLSDPSRIRPGQTLKIPPQS